MKFLTKINRNYFFLLAVTLSMTSIGGYFVLKSIIQKEAKESLAAKADIVKEQIIATGEISNLYPVLEVTKINCNEFEKPLFSEIYIYSELEKEQEPYLEYSAQVKIKGSCYSIKTRQSLLENEDLATILAVILFVVLFSAFLITVIISQRLNRTVWLKFGQNLQKIEEFSFRSNKDLTLLNSNIEEFDRLNKIINNLTDKLKSDYLSLKEFSENASHEIQTPLTIIKLNLEEILQDKLEEDTFKKVVSCTNAVNRLSNLNKSLILLTKIENRQFTATKTISVNNIINKKIQEFEPLIKAKNLNVATTNHHDFQIRINERLAEILINNLLSNAIKHNIDGGDIHLFTNNNKLEICNTGISNSLNDNTIFNRFTKGNTKSYGLGLAIVKNICATHNLEIHYIKSKFHCFKITHKS